RPVTSASTVVYGCGTVVLLRSIAFATPLRICDHGMSCSSSPGLKVIGDGPAGAGVVVAGAAVAAAAGAAVADAAVAGAPAAVGTAPGAGWLPTALPVR